MDDEEDNLDAFKYIVGFGIVYAIVMAVISAVECFG
jgi:hypothetical protein